MPFKGDGRLGGPRRNDSTLNGMSEGPNFPAAGTVFSVQHNVQHEQGLYATGQFEVEGAPYQANTLSQLCSVNLVADGAGGEFLDFANAFNVTFKPYGYAFLNNNRTAPSYVNVGGTDYLNGYVVFNIVHNGSGGLVEVAQSPTYDATGIFYFEGASVMAEYNGTTYSVGNGERQYSHNGQGGYTTEIVDVVYHYSGYQVGTDSGNYTVVIDGTSYYAGYYSNPLYSDGSGGIYSSNGSNGYESSGTYITNYNGYNWYHNGSGGTYTESSGGGGYDPPPSAGTTTGNTDSGTNYIDINGNQYSNGNYYTTEYHDGSGGTYWDTSYNYASYGFLFFSDSWYDEWSNYYVTHYYSDGNGSYYTGT